MNELDVALPPAPSGGRAVKKPYPFHDGSPDENAAIRVIRMWQPVCPVDPTPEIKQKDDTYKANPRYTGEQSCQMLYALNSFGVWDVDQCERVGHDPWHTVIYKRLSVDVVDEDTGDITEQKTKIVKEVRPNIVAVSDNIRHSSGQELALARARGCLTFDEYGALHPDEWYESPCEFRACSQPQRIQTIYGKYCSERHARLIAADKRGIMRYLRNVRDVDEVYQDSKQLENEERIEGIRLGTKEL